MGLGLGSTDEMSLGYMRWDGTVASDDEIPVAVYPWSRVFFPLFRFFFPFRSE